MAHAVCTSLHSIPPSGYISISTVVAAPRQGVKRTGEERGGRGIDKVAYIPLLESELT